MGQVVRPARGRIRSFFHQTILTSRSWNGGHSIRTLRSLCRFSVHRFLRHFFSLIFVWQNFLRIIEAINTMDTSKRVIVWRPDIVSLRIALALVLFLTCPGWSQPVGNGDGLLGSYFDNRHL